MANIVYNSFFEDLMDGSIDLNSDTIKCALMTSAYSPDLAHNRYDDVSTSEIIPVKVDGGGAEPSGYTAGGATLANLAIANKKFTADNPSWTMVNGTFQTAYAIIYKATGDPATSQLICCLDLGGNKTVTNSTFTIQFHTQGIFSFATV